MAVYIDDPNFLPEWTASQHDLSCCVFTPRSNWLFIHKILHHVFASSCDVVVHIKAKEFPVVSGPPRLVFTVRALLSAREMMHVTFPDYVVTKSHVKPDVATRLVLERIDRAVDGIIWDAYITLPRQRQAPTSYLHYIANACCFMPEWFTYPSRTPASLKQDSFKLLLYVGPDGLTFPIITS